MKLFVDKIVKWKKQQRLMMHKEKVENYTDVVLSKIILTLYKILMNFEDLMVCFIKCKYEDTLTCKCIVVFGLIHTQKGRVF
jgi:hypothetical protein